MTTRWIVQACVIATAMSIAMTACKKASVVHLSAQELDGIDRHRQHADSTRITPLEPLFQLALPDTASLEYGLDHPVFLALSRTDTGIVLVGDRVDRAVHLFRTDGAYLGTRAAATATAAPEWMIAGTATSDGAIAVSDLRTSSIVLLDSTAATRRVKVPQVERGVPFGSQVEGGPERTLYEHWFYRTIPNRSGDWSAATPLFRQLSRAGAVTGAFGRIHKYSGELFTAALNRGIVRYQRDTVWFARQSDARILGFPARHSGEQPSRIIELPVFYEMTAPRELIDLPNRIRNVGVEAHVTSFAVTPGGLFLLGQSVSYPRQTGVIARPRTVLTIGCRDGTVDGVYDLGGDIIDLAATNDRVFALLEDRRGSARRIAAFANPSHLTGPATSAGHCKGVLHV